MSHVSEWFDYELPRRLVAQEPLHRRSDARLMVVDRRRQEIEHHHVRDLPSLLAAGDRLVLNDTKVISARLVGKREPSGGRWEGLYLQSTSDGHWRILCKTRGRLKPGDAVHLVDREGRPGGKLWLIESLPDGEWLAHLDADEPAEVVLERVGRVPLPPYIRGGNMVDADVANYQTVFARRPGAVAAPTAGLHFTPSLLRALGESDVSATAVTLHVGLGTFRPISTERLDAHLMHSEWGEISEAAAAEMNATRSQGGRLVAVGTTVTRLLETAVRAGGETQDAAPASRPAIPSWAGWTDLFIRAPFEFHAVDALLTNFHFPRTTLLVLVQTLAGRELITAAYEQAIRDEYRFFSYGDAMLIV
jgi:S-adenosylmethionine:tRNA ribosyltransferase-isomerase